MEKLARKLRQSSTDTELRLWLHLKNRNLGGFKFRRQHPIPPYVVDFVCLERKLIVELDGGQHAEQVVRDAERTARLESMGFRVIRFWNHDALKQTDAVLEEILRQLLAPPPHLYGWSRPAGSHQPSPRKRGEGVLVAAAGGAREW